MDGGAWWAAVYRVAQSRTQLKRLSNSSSSRRPNSWCWEGRGGRRLEAGEGWEEAIAAGCSLSGDRSTGGQIPASIYTGHWHLGRPWPQEEPWVISKKQQPEPQESDRTIGATANNFEEEEEQAHQRETER